MSTYDTLVFALTPLVAVPIHILFRKWHYAAASGFAAILILIFWIIVVPIFLGYGVSNLWPIACGFDVLPAYIAALLVGIPILLLTRKRPIPPGHCQNCRYDLRGQVVPRCPECGTPIEIRKPGDQA